MKIVVLTKTCVFTFRPPLFSYYCLSSGLLFASFNMEIDKQEGSERGKEKTNYEETEDDDEDEMEEDNKRKRALTYSSRKQSGGRSAQACCQVEDCSADMCGAKSYHRRHKVCEFHAKAPSVLIAGLQQRFCQQCSRFHELTEFDDAKRSCRRHLLGHNQRRRKTANDFQGEG